MMLGRGTLDDLEPLLQTSKCSRDSSNWLVFFGVVMGSVVAALSSSQRYVCVRVHTGHTRSRTSWPAHVAGWLVQVVRVVSRGA